MSSLLPVYYQIEQILRNRIINKEFNPGDRIPSENELADQFSVNRLTVRQALLQLVQKGFLISKRGEGTFVTNNEKLISSFNLEFTGFMDDLFYQVSRSKTKSVKKLKVVAPKTIREKLELDKKEEKVIQFQRVRFLEGKPFAYTINYIPMQIGKKIDEKDLYKKPLLQIMEQKLNIKFEEAFQTIEASFADMNIATQFGIPAGSPILFVERIMYGSRRKPVELVQSSYRGDLYKYIVRLKYFRRKNKCTWIHQYWLK